MACELQPTVWDASLRMIRRHVIIISIRDGREGSCALAPPEIKFERQLGGHCTHNVLHAAGAIIVHGGFSPGEPRTRNLRSGADYSADWTTAAP